MTDSEHTAAVVPLPSTFTAEKAFRLLSGRPHCLFLDSSTQDARLGRYSFVAADPFETLISRSDDDEALDRLDQRLSSMRTANIPGLPPFQGGAAGLLSYDLSRQLEKLPTPRVDEFQVPRIALGLYDVVLAFDHVEKQGWIISQGLPEQEPFARERRAWDRLDQFEHWLESPDDYPGARRESSGLAAIDMERLAPQFPVGDLDGLTSTFSRESYLEAAARAIEYIHAGDVFQVNLAQRLLFPAHEPSIDLYLRLRKRNPAPFSGYFDLGDFQIISASPERFLSVTEDHVETRPIKGTHFREKDPAADARAIEALKASEKDRAENVMIVDLSRNDLSRVCRPESVRVTQLCEVETYQYVHHLVSAVEGCLREECSAVDLLKASFPGGSITGAPKIRAMEIIAELEPTARGPYCGSLGYLGFNGTLDLNILIRTITAGRGWWQAPVGGGIVAQSDPQQEYNETWHKAEGLLRAFRP